MSAYLVTREGQELGTFKTSKIEKGLKTGYFRLSDLGWCEASGWQVLTEIVGSTAAPSDSPFMPSSSPNPDSLNPYAAPASETLADSSGVVSPAVMQELAGTRPWVRFLAVMLRIGCAASLLGMGFCIYVIVDAARTGRAPEGMAGMFSATLFYGMVALLLIYPMRKLGKYASTLARLADSRSVADLAASLAEQRRFWKFSGILTIIHVTLTLLLLILSLFFRRIS